MNSMNLSLPGLALANQLYVAVKAQGHGRLGTQSLMLALEQLNGMPSLESLNDRHLVNVLYASPGIDSSK
jgi:hypothetical protein